MVEETQATIVLPPRHPRVGDLIRLERARRDNLLELKAIEAQCEAAAEPHALEIERLEAEAAAAVVAAEASKSHRADVLLAQEKHREVQARVLEERAAQDARLRAESDRLAAVLFELEAADAERVSVQSRTAAQLSQARERFGQTRTTSRGRAIERKIAKIAQQQETIVARNPGARWFRIEIGINAEAHRLGLDKKVGAVSDAIVTPTFREALANGVRALRDELRAEPSEFEIRMRVEAILAEMKVSTDDTEIRVVYRRHNITVQAVGLSDAARARCVAALTGAEDARPVQQEAASAATAA